MLGVVGELLITLGVVAFLYVGWQLWLGDLIQSAQRSAVGAQLSEQWAQSYETRTPAPAASSPTPEPEESPAPAPVLAAPGDGEEFAVLRVPRFGAEYSPTIAGGTSRARTLDPIGVGHYTNTQMPGELGNFALAAHRGTHGGFFNYLDHLQLGDAIVVETADGWYTYRFRTLEYVHPTEVSVLDPVPQAPEVPAGEGYITLTSCNPRWSMDERIVAYGVFEGFTPRADGPPAALTEGVPA